MPHSYSRILLHIVFATKRRYPFIKEHLEEGLYRYIIGTAKNLGGSVIEIGGVEDHIHILTGLKTTVAPAKFLQSLKPSVTLWAKENVHPGFSWQDGYGAFSVSDSDTADESEDTFRTKKNITRTLISKQSSFSCVKKTVSRWMLNFSGNRCRPLRGL